MLLIVPREVSGSVSTASTAAASNKLLSSIMMADNGGKDLRQNLFRQNGNRLRGGGGQLVALKGSIHLLISSVNAR